MTLNNKILYWAMLTWSILATVVNIVGVIWFPPERVTFALGMAGLLFCLFGHISYVVAALVFGSTYEMKRWPLWLTFIHPIFGIIVFTWINWNKLQETKTFSSPSI